MGASSYSTGTASQSGTTISGIGTTFPTNSAPGVLMWPGTSNVIFVTAYTSGTQLTGATSQSVSAAAYVLCYAGVESANGNLGVAGSLYTSVTVNEIVATNGAGVLTGVSMSNGTLIIGNGGSYTVAVPTGTAHEVIITTGAGSLTFGTPQPIDTTSSVTFASITDSGLSQNQLVYGGASGLLTSLGAALNGQIPIGSTGAAPVLATITQNSANQVIVTNGAGTIRLSLPQVWLSVAVYVTHM